MTIATKGCSPIVTIPIDASGNLASTTANVPVPITTQTLPAGATTTKAVVPTLPAGATTTKAAQPTLPPGATTTKEAAQPTLPPGASTTKAVQPTLQAGATTTNAAPPPPPPAPLPSGATTTAGAPPPPPPPGAATTTKAVPPGTPTTTRTATTTVPCNATLCPSGCCGPNGCVVKENMTNSTCGRYLIPGEQCESCPTLGSNVFCDKSVGMCRVWCGPGTCDGCCDPWKGWDNWCRSTPAEIWGAGNNMCAQKDNVTGLMLKGETCEQCVFPETCSVDTGLCVAPPFVCDSTSCPNGCCKNNTCVELASMNKTACGTGTGGDQCNDCTDPTYWPGSHCDLGSGTCSWLCTADTCANGCCSGGTFGNCYSVNGTDAGPFLPLNNGTCGQTNITSHTIIPAAECVACNDTLSESCSSSSGICISP